MRHIQPKFKISKMNKKFVLGFLIAVMSVVVLAMNASAGSLNVTVNHVEVDGTTISGDNAVIAGDTIPVSFELIAEENATGVEVSAWILSFKSETEVSKSFADLIEGRNYNKVRLAVPIPSDLDEDEATERELTLVIRIESDEGSFEGEYTLQAQRQSHNLDFLLVDMDSTADVGSSVPISVVIKNMGRHEEENTIVTVKVPELGISRSAFFEDLSPIDSCDDSEEDNCDEADARERKLFLNIPTNAKAGTYKVEITAKSEEAESSVVKQLTVIGAPVEGKVLANPSSKTFALGEEAVYELVLVNSGNKIAIYNIAPSQSDALSISLSDSVATVPAGSSKVVKISAKANREGTFGFSVTATSENFSETANYTATVQGKTIATSSNVVLLTIVLAIVFVVLVVILIVLLTRKPQKSEEFGESYY